MRPILNNSKFLKFVIQERNSLLHTEWNLPPFCLCIVTCTKGNKPEIETNKKVSQKKRQIFQVIRPCSFHVRYSQFEDLDKN